MAPVPVTVLLLTATSVAVADPSSSWSVPARGSGVVRLSLETELSTHRMFAPASLAPDLTIGVSDRVAVAVYFSRTSQAQIGAGNGICLTAPRETLGGAEPRCIDSALGLGLGARTVVTTGTTARTGLVVRGPGALALELGTAHTGRRGRAWLTAVPTLLVALTGQDRGNRERIQIATYAGLTFGSFELHGRSGLEGAIATFDDTFAVPLGAGSSIVIKGVRVGIDASLDRAFGPLNTLRWRSAAVFVETKLGGAS
jgi:hypothetical protein